MADTRAPRETREGDRDRPPSNLPLQLSSFVGRQREVSEVTRLLAAHRLLTLTGPGGSGKTRLALEFAAGVVRDFDDGVWMVDLAPLADPDLVPRAAAAVLGVRETPGIPLVDSLRAHLRPRRSLLVLDNCEHLVQASADLAAELLRSCRELRVLATSREALGLPGEAIYAVPPLSLPDPRRPPAMENLAGYEASGLFVERARAVRQDFELDEGNAASVAEVCYRLDGIPLAIELAAARVKALSVSDISKRLDDSFALLTSGGRTRISHHRTLRATMDWSYELLTEEERILFRRLSVFAGGFTLEAAEAAGEGEGVEAAEVLPLLSSLVDKSLVQVSQQAGGSRYRYLATVRQYGWGKLEASGETQAIRRRHAEHYVELAEESEGAPKGLDRVLRFTHLETEHDNFRAALSWALAEGNGGKERANLGLRMAVALWPFWYTYGHLSEGREWLTRAASGNSGPATARAKARALNGAGYIALFQGEYETSKGLLEQSLKLYRKIEDREGIASSLTYLGFVSVLGQRDLESLPRLYEEAASLRPYLRDRRVVANLLLFSGLIAISGGDLEEAVPMHEEALSLFREVRDIQGMGHCLNNLAFVAILRSDYEGASALLRDNLQTAREADYKLFIQYSLLGLCIVAARQGHPIRAARLWGGVESMEEAYGIGITRIARSRTNYDFHLSTARSRLGEEAFEAARVEGRAMSPEEATEYALQPEPTQMGEEPAPSAEPAHPAGLSDREVEVLGLVAKGMTNAQIAGELFISPRTVNAHLGSVYRKIGSSTRAEATRFASEHHLL
jgi:non-specific serine/threonine protein kinase